MRRVFFGTLSLVLLFAGIFLLLGYKPWARGAVLGGAASLLNLLVMAGDVRRQGGAAEIQGVRPTYGRYALRMAGIAAVLVYSVTNENVALWATVPALFASQFVMTCGELLGGSEQEPS
ncbi:MAG: ATP synthase subunit I [bacterium]|nr:ATP synthase subunit I [bacterium]